VNDAGVGVFVGVFVGVTVGVEVAGLVGVFVGPGVPSDATTSPSEPPSRFQIERTMSEPFAFESEDIDFGYPASLTHVEDDHVV
jgi:hypothetical protein